MLGSRESTPLVTEALLAFDASALLRIEEIITSPPVEPGSGGAFVLQSMRSDSGFDFALRALAAIAPFATEGVVTELIRWHDRERARGSSLVQPGSDEHALRECAVNCVFCEALLASLGAQRAAGWNRGAILLDSLQERALEFFLLPSVTRQQASRRRLAALGGRSEEALWTELVRALCRHRFESFTHKVMLHLNSSTSSKKANVGPGRGALALCSALRGLQLPVGSGAAAAATVNFLEQLNVLLVDRTKRGLHRPVCEALGSALLEQQLSQAADADAARAAGGADGGGELPGGRNANGDGGSNLSSETGGDGGWGAGASGRDALAVASLHKLQLQLAAWAINKIGMPPKLNAKFESWAAPLATALLCAARGSDGTISDTDLELHRLLRRKLLRCLRQPEAPQQDHASHRVLALRCLRLQLPLLASTKAVSKENLEAVEQLFGGKAMHLELSRERDAVPVSRRYDELLEAHASVALSMASARFEWVVQRLILPALRGDGSNKRLGHPSVLALATLRRLLEEYPDRMSGGEEWSASVRLEATHIVARNVVCSDKSKHLVEGAQYTNFWLLLSQILKGSLRCLCLLWPEAAAGRTAGARATPPPIEHDELLKLLASQLCGTQRPIQSAAAELLARVVSTGAADVLPEALKALTTALLQLSPAGRVRRREALQQVAPLIARWLDQPRVARSLAPCAHQMQALALLLLTDPCPRLRGEAAQLLTLFAPVARAAAASGAAGGAPGGGGAPGPAGGAPAGVPPSLAITCNSSCDDDVDPEYASIAEVLVAALPAIVERALADPLQLELWGSVGGTAAAHKAAGRLRAAAARGCLRGFVETVGGTDGELELWLSCLHGILHTLARAGPACVVVLREVWPMVLPRVPHASPTAAVPASWPPTASLVSACAAVVLADDAGEKHRSQMASLLRDGSKLLLSEHEVHRAAAASILGQLRGAPAMQLVLSELGHLMTNAGNSFETDYARLGSKNPTAKIHMHMRQLAHVLALLAEQDDWPVWLITCGAPLGALSHWFFAALEYLAQPWNLHAWALQRTRKYANPSTPTPLLSSPHQS